MNKQPPEPEIAQDVRALRLLRVRDVLSRLGIGSSTLYRMMQEGTFPRPIEITPGWKAWREADVDAWITARTEAPTVN